MTPNSSNACRIRKPLRPNDADEGRCNERIDEGLPEVQAIWPLIRCSGEVEEWRRAARAQVPPLAALEENPFRAAAIESPEPLEISAFVTQVVIVGDAERHRDVGGLVTFDAKSGSDDVDGNCGGQHDHEQDDSSENRARSGRGRRHVGRAGRKHGHIIE